MADLVVMTYDFVNGTDADADQVDQNFADLVAYLNGRLGAGTNGQIGIHDASGKYTPRSMTGDVTIDPAGVTAIGNLKVLTAMLNDGAVTPPKLASSAVTAPAIGVLPGAKVSKVATQSVPNETLTPVTFGTEEYDTDGMHDNVTNNARLTVATAGLYLVMAGACWESDINNHRQSYITLNGGYIAGTSSSGYGNGNVSLNSVSIISRAVVGDYFRLEVWQNSGGALNVGASPFALTYLAAIFLGKTP